MPCDATIEMQVEAFVELLDQLKIEKTYVLATSAGGTTAIRFALLHPERTKGFILLCSGYPVLEAPKKAVTYVGPPAFFCNDLAMWMISPLFEPIMRMKSETIEAIMPLAERKQGIIFDGKVTNTVMLNHYQDYDMTELNVPVLMIHSKDDKRALWLIVPNAFCAVIWAIIAVDDVMTGSSTKKLIFHSFCAIT